MASTKTAIIQPIHSLEEITVVPKENEEKGNITVWGKWANYILNSYPPSSPEYKSWLSTRIQDAKDGKLRYTADMANVKMGKNVAGEVMNIKDAQRGAHLVFLRFWRDTNPEEYDEFKEEVEAEALY